MFGAVLPLPSVDLLVNGKVVFDEGEFIVGLHFVEQPIWVALEDLREMHADVTGWFTETVHDSAQGSFVNAQHFRQAILPDAPGVHPQFQVRVNVSVQGHGFALVFYRVAASCEIQKRLFLRKRHAIFVPTLKRLFVNILLRSYTQAVPE